MPFAQTAEWWSTTEDDGRMRAEMQVFELRDRFGEVDGNAWGKRRIRGSDLYGEQVRFAKLKTGAAARRMNDLPPCDNRDDCPLPKDDLLRQLKDARTIVQLADHFDCAPRRVDDAIEWLRGHHLLIAETAAGFTLSNTIQPARDHKRIDTAQFASQEFCYGIVADMHIGSKYERLDVLDDLADRWAAHGASRVFVAGNYIDGSGRKFNQHDIYVHGVEGQIGNFIEKLPRREGMQWDVLSGDDHEGWFVQDAHVNIGHVLEHEARLAGRDDIHDLGYMESDVDLVQPHGSSRLRIAHMGGGSSYALSYSMQKYAESLQGGEKPQIVIGGHYHKFDYNYAREMHLIQPGCTQDQTPFMRKKKLQAMIGGCTLWITQNELGIITSCKIEWMPFYDRKFYAYQWKQPA